MKKLCTFIFYDYETFGLHTALDKPAQFSSVSTDFYFNVIDKEKVLYCYPPIDYFPNLESVLLTGITPIYTRKIGVNEAIFSKKISYIFNKPNSCILGYNNINFDDEFTRNIFYRNLIDPYSWSWKNNNSRWDILILLRSCYVLRPEILKWFKNSKGIVSFKLQDITYINNIYHRNMHDATSDVYATIEIAKLIRRANPKFFNFLFRYRLKKETIQLVMSNNKNIFLYISNFFGYKCNYMGIITIIDWHIKNKNILIAFDLSKDVFELIKYFNINQKSILDNKKLFEKGIVFISVNKCPVLLPVIVLRKQDKIRLNINLNYYFRQLIFIKQNSHFFKKIVQKMCEIKNCKTSKNVDLKLYDSFLNFNDSLLIKKIRLMSPMFLSKQLLKFREDRMNEIFFRYKARNFPENLTNAEQLNWKNYCYQYFNFNTLKEYEYLLKKNVLIYNNNIHKFSLLKDMIIYYKNIISKIKN
ncbi:exodeoxyribonuclease I [Buchnera aphidicola (Nipponaphis monzeni)]|uniref:Exodeoxyribonuclease I n=1 Tax=Buchnera aphidicola (Nipponaphis monzeni) TaxID=2495405 RepID=A0A455TAR8_9GAMM|nr:exodeoxyribonuclease I [Buchnera aphidicola]BBI01426.1 exodeoxyribonuclease I [Buchnera aphidicola (Nipponaphis monzeni)]